MPDSVNPYTAPPCVAPLGQQPKSLRAYAFVLPAGCLGATVLCVSVFTFVFHRFTAFGVCFDASFVVIVGAIAWALLRRRTNRRPIRTAMMAGTVIGLASLLTLTAVNWNRAGEIVARSDLLDLFVASMIVSAAGAIGGLCSAWTVVTAARRFGRIAEKQNKPRYI